MKIFNNAAQAWNHAFYWHCLAPAVAGSVPATLSDKIKQAFGSVTRLKEEFAQAAIEQFGSGWAWLVLDDNRLKDARISRGNHCLASVGDRQRHEVIGASTQGRRKTCRNCTYQAFQVGFGNTSLAPRGEMNSVGRLAHGHLRGNLLRVPKFDLCAAGHKNVF